MSRAEQFLDKYRRLEEAAETAYGLKSDGTAVRRLEEMKRFSNIKSQLGYCREVRNLLSHKAKINGEYPVQPSQSMLDLLDKVLERVVDPLRVTDIYTPKNKLLWGDINGFVLPTMAQMHKAAHSHIPVLKNGVVAGLFSENAILRWILKNDTHKIAEELRFADMADIIALDSYHNESFRFVARDTYAAQLSDMFDQAQSKGEKIGMIFVTHSGKETEKLLGIVTAWDVAAAADELGCICG